MDAAWRAPCALGWSKPRVVHALQNREVDFRTWPPGHEAEVDWDAFETAHNFNLETGELSLVGLDLITVGIEVRVAAEVEAGVSLRFAARSGMQVLPPLDAETPSPLLDAEIPSRPADAPDWAFNTVRDLRAAGKIPIKAMESKAALARFLEAEAEKAAQAGRLRHALKAAYIENWLGPWGIWPLGSSK
jgi:hypothetical protein